MSLPLDGCTFAGHAFSVQQREFQARPVPDVAQAVVVKHVPYSDTTMVQLLGRQSPQWQVGVVVPTADLATWEGLVGTRGTLTVLGQAGRTATLLSLAGIEDANIWGFARMTATWLVS